MVKPKNLVRRKMKYVPGGGFLSFSGPPAVSQSVKSASQSMSQSVSQSCQSVSHVGQSVSQVSQVKSVGNISAKKKGATGDAADAQSYHSSLKGAVPTGAAVPGIW